MCGIVGVLSNKPVSTRLVDGLKRLEYRGYDSSGIAVLDDKNEIVRRRSVGKLHNLETLLKDDPIIGMIGIGHTRWATHGKADVYNAHPHGNKHVVIVHNGIIENFSTLKNELQNKGYVFESETDTEVVVHLLTDFLKEYADPTLAVQKMIKRLEGAFALGIMIKKYPNYLFAARCGSPLVLGISSDDLYIGSDALALSAWTNKVCYLKEGDMAILKKDGQAFSYTVYDSNNNEVQRPIQQSNINMSTITKGTFDHYMLKEIYEQPKSILETLENLLYIKTLEPKGDLAKIDWKTIKNIVLIACGTSYYACLVAKYWFEKISKIKVDVDIASEFRYRSPVLNSYDLAIVVSQSGETIDTLSALKMLKNSGCLVSAIVNVDESSIAREADFVFLTQAGPEIGVASTKAFTSQLITFMVLVLESAFKKGNITNDYYKQNIENISHLPKKTLDVLKLNEKIQILSNSLTSVNSALFLGRGTNYPIALEGALKLKEISYIHAEGYPAGELKHGPIALIDKSMPVIVIAPHDEWFEKTSSNVQEVIARGANVIFITDYVGEELMRKQGITNIPYVTINFESDVFTNSIFYSIIVQLLAYYTAYYKGTDVDQPRNLAKSVTVE